MRHHAPRRVSIRKRLHRVRRPAILKRADFLQVFTLKKNRRPRQRVDRAARHHRRAMNKRPDPLVRRANRLKIGNHEHGQSIRATAIDAKPQAIAFADRFRQALAASRNHNRPRSTDIPARIVWC